SDADPNGTASNYTVTVNTGDAILTSSANPGNVKVVAHTGGGFDVQLTYTYAEELSGASFSVSVSDHNATTSRSSTFSVADAALTAGALTPPVATEGQPVSNAVLFHFSDADPAGTASDYTATVTWGDGVVENSVSNPTTVLVVAHAGGGFDVIGSHTYAE